MNFNNDLGASSPKDGICQRLGMNEYLISDAQAYKYISFHKDKNPQAVFVGENFGCIHFSLGIIHDENNK